MLDPQETIKFADFHEQYVSKYIALADTKATISFAASGGLISWIVANDILDEALSLRNPAIYLPTLIAVLALGTSFLYSVAVIRPRLGRSGKDLVFWQGVAEHKTARDYVAVFDDNDEASLADHRLVHCYDLSKVCASKYKHLSVSVTSAAIGIALTAIGFAMYRLHLP